MSVVNFLIRKFLQSAITPREPSLWANECSVLFGNWQWRTLFKTVLKSGISVSVESCRSHLIVAVWRRKLYGISPVEIHRPRTSLASHFPRFLHFTIYLFTLSIPTTWRRDFMLSPVMTLHTICSYTIVEHLKINLCIFNKNMCNITTTGSRQWPFVGVNSKYRVAQKVRH